ncbi:MAG TPA: hypothetical protein P5246_01980, partial [Candidatus Omnitrophota bacterium]|nr:hypothetical protein [Candidatus Omnitrophota bacterium]
ENDTRSIQKNIQTLKEDIVRQGVRIAGTLPYVAISFRRRFTYCNAPATLSLGSAHAGRKIYLSVLGIKTMDERVALSLEKNGFEVVPIRGAHELQMFSGGYRCATNEIRNFAQWQVAGRQRNSSVLSPTAVASATNASVLSQGQNLFDNRIGLTEKGSFFLYEVRVGSDNTWIGSYSVAGPGEVIKNGGLIDCVCCILLDPARQEAALFHVLPWPYGTEHEHAGLFKMALRDVMFGMGVNALDPSATKALKVALFHGGLQTRELRLSNDTEALIVSGLTSIGITQVVTDVDPRWLGRDIYMFPEGGLAVAASENKVIKAFDVLNSQSAGFDASTNAAVLINGSDSLGTLKAVEDVRTLREKEARVRPSTSRVLYQLAQTVISEQGLNQALENELLAWARAAKDMSVLANIAVGWFAPLSDGSHFRKPEALMRVLAADHGLGRSAIQALMDIALSRYQLPVVLGVNPRAPPAYRTQFSTRNVYGLSDPQKAGLYISRLKSINIDELKEWLTHKLHKRTHGKGRVLSIVVYGSYIYGFRVNPSDLDIIAVVDAPLLRETVDALEPVTYSNIPRRVFNSEYARDTKELDVKFVTLGILKQSKRLSTKVANAGIMLRGNGLFGLDLYYSNDVNRLAWAHQLINDADLIARLDLAVVENYDEHIQSWLGKGMRRIFEANQLISAVDRDSALSPEFMNEQIIKAVHYLEGGVKTAEFREGLRRLSQKMFRALLKAKVVAARTLLQNGKLRTSVNAAVLNNKEISLGRGNNKEGSAANGHTHHTVSGTVNTAKRISIIAAAFFISSFSAMAQVTGEAGVFTVMKTAAAAHPALVIAIGVIFAIYLASFIIRHGLAYRKMGKLLSLNKGADAKALFEAVYAAALNANEGYSSTLTAKEKANAFAWLNSLERVRKRDLAYMYKRIRHYLVLRAQDLLDEKDLEKDLFKVSVRARANEKVSVQDIFLTAEADEGLLPARVAELKRVRKYSIDDVPVKSRHWYAYPTANAMFYVFLIVPVVIHVAAPYVIGMLPLTAAVSVIAVSVVAWGFFLYMVLRTIQEIAQSGAVTGETTIAPVKEPASVKIADVFAKARKEGAVSGLKLRRSSRLRTIMVAAFAVFGMPLTAAGQAMTGSSVAQAFFAVSFETLAGVVIGGLIVAVIASVILRKAIARGLAAQKDAQENLTEATAQELVEDGIVKFRQTLGLNHVEGAESEAWTVPAAYREALEMMLESGRVDEHELLKRIMADYESQHGALARSVERNVEDAGLINTARQAHEILARFLKAVGLEPGESFKEFLQKVRSADQLGANEEKMGIALPFYQKMIIAERVGKRLQKGEMLAETLVHERLHLYMGVLDDHLMELLVIALTKAAFKAAGVSVSTLSDVSGDSEMESLAETFMKYEDVHSQAFKDLVSAFIAGHYRKVHELLAVRLVNLEGVAAMYKPKAELPPQSVSVLTELRRLTEFLDKEFKAQSAKPDGRVPARRIRFVETNSAVLASERVKERRQSAVEFDETYKTDSGYAMRGLDTYRSYLNGLLFRPFDQDLKALRARHAAEPEKTVRVVDIGAGHGLGLHQTMASIDENGLNVEGYGISLTEFSRGHEP